MDTKKIGYVGLGIMGVYLILAILDASGKASFLPQRFDASSYIYSLLLLGAGCWLFIGEEHVAFGYIDLIAALLSIIIIFISDVISYDSYSKAMEFFNSVLKAVLLLLLVNLPLLIRTQSPAHKAFKWITIMIIVLYSVLTMAFSKSNENYTAETVDWEKVQTRRKISNYVTIILECVLFCNPMIALATSEEIIRKSRPNMPDYIYGGPPSTPSSNPPSINGGINYGDMPVPDGVVASQDTVGVPSENNGNVSLELPVNNTPAVPAEPAQPQQAMSTAEVAPELQFLLDNNQENK